MNNAAVIIGVYLRNEKEFRRLAERSSAVQFDTLATKAKLIDASKTYPNDFVNKGNGGAVNVTCG